MLLATGGGSSHDEEAPRLPEQAPAGDGGAFTLLYDLFEQRVFNFCHRLLGSAAGAGDATQATFLTVLAGPRRREGHDSNFRAHLFAAAHDFCHELIARGTVGATGQERPGREADEVFVDPERAVLLAGLQDQVRAANRNLAVAEREVLALRELEYFSYAEIAEIMRTDHDSVAELVARARTRLRAEVRGGSLAHELIPAPDCRRAQPLIAMTQDAQPDAEAERDWLTAHLEACETCQARRDAMEEAGISYRAWLRIVPLYWLREVTLAEAAELAAARPDAVGDQSLREEDELDPDCHADADGDPDADPDPDSDADPDPPPDAAGAASHEPGLAPIAVARDPIRGPRSDRRRFALGAFSTVLLLLAVGAAMVLASAGSPHREATRGHSITDPPTAASASAPVADTPTSRRPARHRARRRVLSRTTPSTGPGEFATRVAASPKPRRRTSGAVHRTVVRGGAEGGAFVRAPTSPPRRSTPTAPPSAPSPRHSGGSSAPTGKTCGTTSGPAAAC